MKRLFTVLLLAFLTFGIAPAAFSQVTVAPFTTAQVQFFDNSGNACASCQLQTLAAGTTTPLASYSDLGVTLNANPIILDSAGVATIFLTSASYKFVLKGSVASGGATIRTVDNITWSTPLSTFNGITSTGDVILQQSTAATSGANQSSNNLKIQGRYWTGSADATETCQIQNVLGTGANPSVTLTLTCSGSSGTVTFSIPSAAVSFGGSTTLNGGTLNGTYGGTPTFSGTITFSNLLTALGFVSSSANASSAGAFRLATSDTGCWRNAANGANVCLSDAGASSAATGGLADNLKWNGGGYQAVAFVDLNTQTASSGVLRVGNNVVAVAARNTLNNGDLALLQSDGSNNVQIGPQIRQVEQVAPTGIASSDLIWADSTAHRWKMLNNNGTAKTVAATDGDTFTTTSLTSPTITGTAPYNRLRANQGTALVTGDVGALVQFGSTATVSAVAGTDSAGTISIASAGVGQAANGTFTLTFHDGTWTTAPVCVANRGDGNGPNSAPVATSTNATTATFIFSGTAVAGTTYAFNFICVGK